MIDKWNKMETNEIINKKFKQLKTEQCIFLIFNSFIVLFYFSFFFSSFTTLWSVDSLWYVYVTWQEHTVKCTVQISAQNCWVFVYELSDTGFESSCSHLNFRFWACFEQGVPGHWGNLECVFTLKRVSHMTITYSQMHGLDK